MEFNPDFRKEQLNFYMKKKSVLRIIFLVLGGITVVFLMMAALLPLLEQLLNVEVKTVQSPMLPITSTPPKTEDVLLTAVYVREEEEKDIAGIFIEVLCPDSEAIFYVEIPVDAKVTLSEELYKSLQAYSPELPQYLKLQKMAEGFSEEYVYTGCNRILSEVLGVTISHYLCTTEEGLEQWQEILQSERVPTDFFESYTWWLASTGSDRSEQERWIWYESFYKRKEIVQETIPGTTQKDAFEISKKQAKERLELLMQGK